MNVTELDVETIEALDFDYTPPCEATSHGRTAVHDDGGAYALVRVEQGCGHNFSKLYCRSFVMHLTGPWPMTHCHICGDWEREASYTIIAYVGSP